MITAEEKYILAFRVAVVAGVFTAVVSALLLLEYRQRVAEDPLNAPEFLKLKTRVVAEPQNEDLKQQLRRLDQQLRIAYFDQRAFALWGTWLLLGGVVGCLVAAKWAATLHRQLPHPEPRDGTLDAEERIKQTGRWAVAGLAGVLVLAAAALYTSLPSALPSDPDELAALLKTESPAGDARRQQDAPRSQAGMKPDRPPPEGVPGSKEQSPSASANGAQGPAKPTAAKPTTAAGGQDAPPLPAGFPSDEQLAQNWPRFRGPGGSGTAVGGDYPIAWDHQTGQGIRWKTPVPLPGNSSPIVWEDKLFATGADENRREVYCFDAERGDLLWQTPIPPTPQSPAEPPEVGEDTGFAAPTPVTDGRCVYAMFANGDIGAVDYQGRLRWARSLGLPKNAYGHAASLAMYQDRVIVQFDQGGRKDGLSKLLALAADSGQTVWETPRAVPNSWPSPIVIRHAGRPQIITAADPWVIAYAPDDGKELWRAECLEADVGPSPTYIDGLVFVANEFPGGSVIRPDGAGDVTETHIVWQTDFGAPDCCSPLATDKYVLLLASYGTLTCFDAKRGGDPLWEEDFDDDFVSSPSLAGNRVYLFGSDGKSWVVEPAPEQCRRVGEGNLGEDCVASPAFHSGRIYVRGKEHLFCIGEDQKTE